MQHIYTHDARMRFVTYTVRQYRIFYTLYNITIYMTIILII